jgi:hypothetical protein
MSDFDILVDEHDLSYRPKVGDTSYYHLNIIYRSLDERGLVASRENYAGDFRRVVTSSDPSRVDEQITWRNIIHRTGEGLTAPWTPTGTFDWAKEFSYAFSGEDDHEDFFKWDFSGFPRDLDGWNVLLLAVDAHFEFDYLRSSRHGAIGTLRRIGDEIVGPDSDKPFRIPFLPLIEVPAFTKRNMRTRFEGLTLREGKPCALLSFNMDPSPFTMTMGGNEMQSTSTFAGTLDVRLTDGALEHGQFLEWVFTTIGVVSPMYEITRIEASGFEGR